MSQFCKKSKINGTESLMMSGDIFNSEQGDERLCITQYEQREYDSCSWENEDFAGKAVVHICCGTKISLCIHIPSYNN